MILIIKLKILRVMFSVPECAGRGQIVPCLYYATCVSDACWVATMFLFIPLLRFSKSGTNPGWLGPWYSVAFLRALRSVNIVWWMPPCVCLWKLINLMVRVIFCCACSYSKMTAKSLGWSADSQACSVGAWVSCQHLFLMPRWLYSVRNATFQIILGTNWHSVFSACPQGL